MSHFEYVSVAVALVSALAVGRLLSGFSASIDRERRYWIHVGWVVGLLLACVAQWWGLWRMHDVSWDPVRFLWVLAMPGLLLVQATVLVSEEPSRVASYRAHYFQQRTRFFALTLASAVVLGLSAWVFGNVPWLRWAPVHPVALALGGLGAVGLASSKPIVHACLVATALVISVSSFFLVPPVQQAA